MNANTRLSLMTGALAATLLGAQVAVAGPYPIKQLEQMLTAAEAELAVVERSIEVLATRMDEQRELIDGLGIQFKKTGTRADFDNYQQAKSALEAMEQDMSDLEYVREEILVLIDFIMVQFEAWEEINGGGDPPESGSPEKP